LEKQKIEVTFCYCLCCGKKKNTFAGALCDYCSYGRMISFEELCADLPAIKSLTLKCPPTPGLLIEFWQNHPPPKF
jgi:hypothetical protein